MRLRLASVVAAAVLFLAPAAAFAFSVRPSLLDVQANPGSSARALFTVLNPNPAAQTYFLSSMAFAPRDESGAPVFDPKDSNGVAQWVHFSAPSVSVPGAGKTDVSFSVDVPAGTKPGGYYVAVLVSPAPADVVSVVSGASIEAKVAVLTFVTVGGAGMEKVGLLDFSMAGNQSVRDGLWGTYSYRLQNQGDVHVIPRGTVRVRDAFGQVIAEGPANSANERLMPATTRTFSGFLVADEPKTFWDAVRSEATHFAIGPVTVEINLTPGLVPNQPLVGTIHVWIIPWQLLATVFGGIAVLYGLMKLLMRAPRRP